MNHFYNSEVTYLPRKAEVAQSVHRNSGTTRRAGKMDTYSYKLNIDEYIPVCNSHVICIRYNNVLHDYNMYANIKCN